MEEGRWMAGKSGVISQRWKGRCSYWVGRDQLWRIHWWTRSTLMQFLTSQDFHPAQILIFQKSPFEARQQTRADDREAAWNEFYCHCWSQTAGPQLRNRAGTKVKLSPDVLKNKKQKIYCSFTKWMQWMVYIYLYLLIRAANLYRYACQYLEHQKLLTASLYWQLQEI